MAKYKLKRRQMCGRHKFSIFLLSIYISNVFCADAGVTTYTSYEGGSVDIRCPYEPGYEDNIKYLCRGKCSTVPFVSKDIPIQSGVPAKDQRFTLNDDTRDRIFTVTITDLKPDDGGQYWCAINKIISDVYTKIQVNIRKVVQQSGIKGKELHIRCHYEHDAKQMDKFFCKGKDPSVCETSGIKVSAETNKTGRFSLSDDISARDFIVTITDPREEDSGIYWCGYVLNGTHNEWISAIDLKIYEVTPGTSTTSKRTSPQITTTASFYSTKPASADPASNRPVTTASSLLLLPSSPSSSINSLSPKPQSGFISIIMLLVIGMLLVFGFLVIVYIRWKQKKKELQFRGAVHYSTQNLPNGEIGKTKEGTHIVCDYEEIHLTNEHPDYSLVYDVFGEDDASDYAVAQLPSIASDSVTYSTITLENTAHSDRNSPDGQTTCDYATVNP
ncbi:CMRF35-like molecule 8 isoform X1 [Xyrauchen texanus]|uniref:CMRF35-like molecule 8 isoform X1 n=1 Tax=Xyrauchen texanus TaxID=154827 RepID=UPI0022420FE2|nr:CMRF35-like molecule 8 isoform X1 [Xyrauchen texanus]